MAISLGTFPTVKGETAKHIVEQLRASASTASKEKSDAYIRAKRLQEYRAANGQRK